jgi:hypothetical protein
MPATLRFLAVVALCLVVPWEALAQRRGTADGQQTCDQAIAQYKQAGQLIEASSGVVDADIQTAILRQGYISNLMLSQLAALQLIQWFSCELPRPALAKVPELNMSVYQPKADMGTTQQQAAAQAEGKLKRYRGRVLDLLREVGNTNALPAACAGSSSFASSDMRGLYDFLYQAGYGTGDIDYFNKEYDKAFNDQLKVQRAALKQSGFDAVCGKDMVGETRKAFEKMDQIKTMFR